MELYCIVARAEWLVERKADLASGNGGHPPIWSFVNG
jgi:hypothetical protein